ncbi:MAG: hypothetical protein J6J36_06985 [Clostridia bacterium]|nr:hypothetical protein [Clostridia bacterium]
MLLGDYLVEQLQKRLGVEFEPLTLYSIQRAITFFSEDKSEQARKELNCAFTYRTASMIEFYIEGCRDCIKFQKMR